jgi:SRSO17 transposase
MIMYHISPEGLPELSVFMGHFDEYCHRLETWQAMEDYIKGLLLPIERKNCEQMAAAIPGCHAQRLHNLLTTATWDEHAVNDKRLELFLGREPGYLIFDDTGIPKKGSGSVGAARQYSGTLGKIGNCQVIVTSQFVTPQGKSCPVDAKLYLPAEWTNDPARCRRFHVPENTVFQTKTEIAIDLLDQAITRSLPIRAVLGDAGYGRNPDLVEAIEKRGIPYLLAVPACFGVRKIDDVKRAQEELKQAQATTLKGRPRKRLLTPSYTAQTLTDELPDDEWQTISWREGSKGLLTKQFCRVRVHWASGDRIGSEVWLIGERPLPGHDGEAKWYICDFSPDTPLTEMADTAHQRWHIERYYQDAKTELGFDHYEGRSWIGLHRHLSLVMLAYTWLLLQDNGDKNPEASGIKLFSYGRSSKPRPEPAFAVVRHLRHKVLERFQYTWFTWLFQNQVYRSMLDLA